MGHQYSDFLQRRSSAMRVRIRLGQAEIMLAVIAALALFGNSPREAYGADPFLIGVSAPTSGDNAAAGQDAVNAANLAAEQINAKGGILGRPVQIVTGDDRCDPKEGAIVAQKFVAQKITAAASHYCSGAALAAIPIFKEAGILYVDWGASSSKIPASDYDKLFTTFANASLYGAYSANVAVTTLHKMKFAIVDDRTPANGEYAVAFQKKAKELGAEVVLAGHVTVGDKDFSAFVTQVKGSGADALYVSLYYAESGLLARQLRDQQVEVTIICMDASMDPQYIHVAGAAAEGVYVVTSPQATELPAAKEYVAEYNKKFGKEPGYIGPYAYDAINVIAQGYSIVGKFDNDAAAKWLKSLKKETALKGITGPLYWNPDGSLQEFVFSVYQVKNGKFEFAMQ
jgi:branched-chain amino acid transport system substrate-binding protein